MHFRVRYVADGLGLNLDEGEVLEFPFDNERHAIVRLLVVHDENSEVKEKIFCEGIGEQQVEPKILESFSRLSEGTPLEPGIRAFFDAQVSELADYMQKIVTVLRWHYSLMDGPINPFRNGTEAYSFDGSSWHEGPMRAVSATLVCGHPYPKAKVSRELCEEIVALVNQGVDEPFERQLFREAWNLRTGFPKAALVIGVAAAEIGFRRVVGPIGGSKGIFTLLSKYWPHPSAIPIVQRIQIKASAAVLSTLKKGIHKRDAVVHEGAAAPDRDELRDILWNISQLLYIWDFHSGHEWALGHIAAPSVEVLAPPKTP